MFNCLHCQKTFGYESLLLRHTQTCKKQDRLKITKASLIKDNEDLYGDLLKTCEEHKKDQAKNSLELDKQREEIASLKDKLKLYESENLRIKKENITLDADLTLVKKENVANFLKIKSLTAELDVLKEKLKEQEKLIFHLEKENKNLNKTIEMKEEKLSEQQNVNITFQLNQLNQINIDGKVNYKSIVEKLPCVSSGDLDTIFKNMPVNKLDSIKTLTDYVSTNYLNKRVICTDKARRTIAWKDENLKIIKDKNGFLLSKKVKKIGKANKENFDGLLKGFDSSIDQTNISHINSINNKNDTVVSLLRNNSDFESEFTKSIINHTPHVKSFTQLPKVDIENYTKSIKTWCNNFSTDNKVNLTKFLYLWFKTFLQVHPDKSHNILNMYLQCINKTIYGFMDCCNVYFKDDADNICIDYKGKTTFSILRNFLRSNQAPSALKKNHYKYFEFSQTDIQEITSEDLFEGLCFETFHTYIHCNFDEDDIEYDSNDDSDQTDDEDQFTSSDEKQNE